MRTPYVYTKANQSKDMAKILGAHCAVSWTCTQRTSAGESCSDRLQLASTSTSSILSTLPNSISIYYVGVWTVKLEHGVERWGTNRLIPLGVLELDVVGIKFQQPHRAACWLQSGRVRSRSNSIKRVFLSKFGLLSPLGRARCPARCDDFFWHDATETYCHHR
jgi:hypothetical protein